MGDDFVGNETKRLPIGDERWIEVKMELSHGEIARLNGGLLQVNNLDGDVGINWAHYALLKTEMWVVDWNLTSKGHPVKVSRQAISNLKESTAQAIEKALDAHITAMEAEKNVMIPTGSSESEPKSS